MKKLLLEDIQVDSFATGESTELRGTVQGRESDTVDGDPISKTCVSDITWINGPVCCALY